MKCICGSRSILLIFSNYESFLGLYFFPRSSGLLKASIVHCIHLECAAFLPTIDE